MALSKQAKEILVVALANAKVAKEVSDAIDAGSNEQAASVTALSAYVPVTGVDGTGSNAASKANVDTQLSAVYTKINAILTALKNAGIMA